MLVGNNEDWKNPNTRIWFEPAEKGKYGRVYFGFDNFRPQGGMNEKGLVFDGFATAPNEVKKSLEKPVYGGHLLDKCMAECATVEEVLDLLDRYNLKFMEPAMYFVADARGDSAIIEGDVIIRKQGRYQVVTNFYQSQIKDENITCERYKIANQMLRDAEEVSIDLCKRILAATHNENVTPTLYSNIYDIKNRVVYLYYFHNFQNEVKIDLRAELAKGRRRIELPALFPKAYSAEMFRMVRGKDMKLEQMHAGREVTPKLLEAYTGRYRITEGEYKGLIVTVTSQADLFAQAEGFEKSDLHAISDEEFVHVNAATMFKLTFVRDKNGQVAELRIENEGQTHTAERIK